MENDATSQNNNDDNIDAKESKCPNDQKQTRIKTNNISSRNSARMLDLVGNQADVLLVARNAVLFHLTML